MDVTNETIQREIRRLRAVGKSHSRHDVKAMVYALEWAEGLKSRRPSTFLNGRCVETHKDVDRRRVNV